MADTIENFVRAGSFRESWRDRFQNKWPAMTTMMMRSESEIDYPNITPCPDFGIKNPSIRSWGSNPETWTGDSRGGEITDEESSSRVTKGDKRCEKICRGILCIFLVLSVLAAAFAGIGLSVLLTRPEFGLTGHTRNSKDSFVDAALEEKEQMVLTGIFCDVVIKMLNDSHFPIDRGILSCETILKYSKGLEGLHIEIDVKPTEGYTLKEKFLRSLRKMVAKRKDDVKAHVDTATKSADSERNIFANTGLIFPKTGGFIEFLPEIWKSGRGNDSDNVTDLPAAPNQLNITTNRTNTAGHPDNINTSSKLEKDKDEKDKLQDGIRRDLPAAQKQSNITMDSKTSTSHAENINSSAKLDKFKGEEINLQVDTITQSNLTVETENSFKKDTQKMKIASANIDKTGNNTNSEEQVKAVNKSTSIKTDVQQSTTVDLTLENTNNQPSDIIEDVNGISSSSTTSATFTTPTFGGTISTDPANFSENASTSSTLIASTVSSKIDEEVTTFSSKFSNLFETTLALDTTTSMNSLLNTTSTEFEKETTITLTDDMPTSALQTSTNTVNKFNITTPILKETVTENIIINKSEITTKETKEVVAIKSVKLFEVNKEGDTSGLALNASIPNTKRQKDFVAESLMSGGFMRLPMKTTSNFKFLFSSGNRKTKVSDIDSTDVASTVVVKERKRATRLKT